MKKYVILLLSLIVLTTCESDDPIQFKLSTQTEPKEGGSISPSAGTFDKGDEVTLKATPNDEYVFKNWSDDAVGDENPMTVVMTDDMFVTANFEKRTYSLTIEIQGEGTVKEEIIAAKSTTEYPSGTTVQLTAIPDDDWGFVKWEGDHKGSENPLIISISEPIQLTAVFQKVNYDLTIEIIGQGTVKEEIIAAKSTTEYPSGTTVQLTAIPDDDWGFVKWEGDHSGSENPLELLIDKPMSVTATFTPIDMEQVFVPDDNFEQALINLGLDDVLDDYVYLALIKNIEELRLEGRQIQDLTGIEAFENLVTLIVSNNSLSSIDLSQNTRLQTLVCDNNQLTSLDISDHVYDSVVVTGNQLSCIKVHKGQLFVDKWAPGLWLTADEGVSYSVDCSITEEDLTYVPDNGLEQALIDLNLDDVLDDYVRTIDIVNRTALDLSGKNISDITGMEDFQGLWFIDLSNNNLSTFDMTILWPFFDLDLRNNPLQCIQVNEFWLQTGGGGIYFMWADEGVQYSLDCGY